MESGISNFKWFLPRAFNDAIYKCKFEQGDILYPSYKGYFKWEDAKHNITQFIQVKSTSGLSEEDSKGCATIQCSAKTQDGTRCLRKTTNCNGRCWQHQ